MRFKQSSFSILTIFTVLVLIGVALLPKVQTRLLPNRYQPRIYVTFGMRGANAVVVDNEVTSKLEGIFSRLQGIEKLESNTREGGGQLVLHLDEDVNMDAIRFEVATLVRQIYPELPDEVSYPNISMTGGEGQDRPERIMGFTLSGKASSAKVGAWAENHIVPILSEVEGVQDVFVFGANPYEWELVYNRDRLEDVGLSLDELKNQIRRFFYRADLGNVNDQTYTGKNMSVPVVYQGLRSDHFIPEALHIRHEGRLFKLTELINPKKVIRDPSRYERINGLEAINIVVTARGSANFIVSAEELKDEAQNIISRLPEGYSLQINYDASEFIKDELLTIVLRVSASLLILLSFVYVVSRSLRYFAIVSLSILVNVFIAFAVYYFLNITIHRYSVAGIAISLGIIIDNTIVVVDQLRHKKSMGVIRAVVAATLTTIGSLIIVWFLDNETQLKLIDFTLVMIINLTISLVVSFFFIPALMDKLPLRKRALSRRMKKTRRIIRFTRFYARPVFWLKGKRWLVWLVLIIGFGLPVFMLPNHIKGDKFYIDWYNTVFGSRAYSEHIRPVTDVALGGVLRLFIQGNKGQQFNQSDQRTVLNVSGTMDDGTTLEKTNEVFKRIENFLSPYDEIEQFQTSIYSPSSSRLSILFKPEEEHGSFPHQLKSELERFCIDLGGADWQITGVGRGFDNSLHEGRRNNRMTLYGYNLDELKGYAEKLKNYLFEIERVDNESVFVNGRATFDSKIHREYELSFDDDRMMRTGVSRGAVLRNLQELSNDHGWVMTTFNQGRYENVFLKEDQSSVPDLWEFSNLPLEIGKDRYSKFNEYGEFTKKRQQELINKEDMQYTMVVEFDFIGSWGQQQYFLGQVEDRLNQQLPIGYYVKPMQNYGGRWGEKTSDNKKLWLVLLVIGIIYFVTSVVFGSILQPLLVILLIPVSFIGTFLTFYIFDIPFNEGGFAALVLLSGLTVNSVIYILNDLNLLRQLKSGISQERLYMKAFNQKIIPILLTIVSTALGLAPFLFGDESNSFWLSLSAGTIGGLLFSAIGLLLILPVFAKKSKIECVEVST